VDWGEEFALDLARALYRDAPETRIALELPPSPEELVEEAYLGAGAHGAAFEHGDDTVLKLTVDRDDAYASAIVKDEGPVPGVVEIGWVGEIPLSETVTDRTGQRKERETIWAILAERVDPAPDWINYVSWQIDDARYRGQTKRGLNEEVDRRIAQMRSYAAGDKDELGLGPPPVPRGFASWEEVAERLDQLRDSWNRLRDLGIELIDFSKDNIGMRDGDPVFLDLGFRSYVLETEPELPLLRNGPRDLKFESGVTGAAYGQIDAYVTAIDVETSRVVGYLSYSVFEDRPYLNIVQVAPEARGEGIGTKLVEELLRDYPYDSIVWGLTTREGTALKAKLDARHR